MTVTDATPFAHSAAGGPTAPVGTPRLFLAGSPHLDAHRRTYGPLPGLPAEALIEQLRASGLDGRGGAGFPVWRKLASTRAHSTGRAVVIANGSEGEPLSRKDETLLRQAPHLVIDGLLLAASAVGASDLHLSLPAELQPAVAATLAERPDARRVRLVLAPESFVAGEATAAAGAVERGISLPRDHVLHLSERGVRGRATLVQNVETLAHLALIARFGAEWFRSVGTPDEPGTRLVTVSGDVARPQVLEVAGGTPLSAIVAACEPGGAGIRAALVGGYHGGWVTRDGLDLPLSRAALAPFGAAPGAGVVFVLGADRCGLDASASIATYLAGQSTRQCGPCVNGLPAMASALSSLAARSRDPRLPAEIARLADLVTGRGSCAHPDGTARFVLSTLTAFAADVRAHLSGTCETLDRSGVAHA